VYCGLRFRYGICEVVTANVSRGAYYSLPEGRAAWVGIVLPFVVVWGRGGRTPPDNRKNANTDVCIFFYFSSHCLRAMGCSPPLAHHGGFATVAKQREQSPPIFFVRGVVRGKGGDMSKPLFRYHSTLILKVARLRGGSYYAHLPTVFHFANECNGLQRAGCRGFLRCFWG